MFNPSFCQELFKQQYCVDMCGRAFCVSLVRLDAFHYLLRQTFKRMINLLFQLSIGIINIGKSHHS